MRRCSSKRIALAVTVQAESPRRMTAFNDVVVARVPGFGTARLRVDVDRQAMLALGAAGDLAILPPCPVKRQMRTICTEFCYAYLRDPAASGYDPVHPGGRRQYLALQRGRGRRNLTRQGV